MSWRRRILRTGGALALSARTAASRFLPLERVRRPRGAWRPIALRWRTGRSQGRWIARSHRATPTAHSVLVRLDMRPGRRVVEWSARRLRPARVPTMWRPPIARTFAAPVPHLGRPAAGAPWARPPARGLHSAVATRLLLAGGFRPIPATERSLRPAGAPASMATAGRVRRSFVVERPGRTSRGLVAERAPAPRRRTPGLHARERHVLHATPMRLPAPTARRSGRAESPRRAPHPAPEIVWRRAPAVRTDAAEGGARAEIGASAVRGSTPAVPAGGEAASATSPHAGRPAAPLLARLDPALVDRLTDDVIRRVERRVRIERERRGL